MMLYRTPAARRRYVGLLVLAGAYAWLYFHDRRQREHRVSLGLEDEDTRGLGARAIYAGGIMDGFILGVRAARAESRRLKGVE